MKKSLVLAGLLAIGSTAAMAADDGVYVGIDIGNTAMDYDISASNGYSESGDDNGGSQTLKIGYYFDKQNRAGAFYQHVNVDNGKAYITGIGYDYLIGENDFRPFVGAILGYGRLKDDDGITDITGALYGAQVGLNYTINENFSAEAGYRFMKSNMEDTIVDSGVSVTIDLDPVTNWFFGVNYKF